MIARVATDAALNRAFDYLIPPELEGRVVAGSRVRVSFGRRELDAIVLEIAESTTVAAATLKPVIEVVGERALILPELLELGKWIGGYYLAPIEIVLNTLLPPSVRKQGGAPARERLYVEVVGDGGDGTTLTKRQREILDYITRGGDGYLAGICQQWKVTPETVRKIAALGYLRITTKSERRDPLGRRNYVPTQPLPLSEEQKVALDAIINHETRENLIHSPCLHASVREKKEFSPPKPIVLFGVTASGKTEVYLQAIDFFLKQGKGAIVLVPEIALTPQMIQRFASRFGNNVAVLHSQLSDGERHDEWHRIRAGEARVVVGPRSAVFAPVENLGILIVDEEHEPSYKQDEKSPRYHARDVAVMRGHIQKCVVVLGSATPSLESWNNVAQGKYALTRMRARIPGAQPPHTTVVDMRHGEQKNGVPQVFSRELIEAIKRRLETGEQVMLFLNRRGYAPGIVCPQCGFVLKCEDCTSPMTYHLRDNILRCHLCAAFREVPQVCPECQSADIYQRGIGTQRVEVIARKIFPRARIERMDTDVTTRKSSHEEILARFRAGQTDILIGTQMIAKGLDFPNVTLVGILNADAGLFIPDFRAAERTFQLIAQMSGRSGRGSVAGEVMVQTTNPQHPAIAHARKENYEAFAEEELRDRREANFPPFMRMICVTFKGKIANEVERCATAFSQDMKRSTGLQPCDNKSKQLRIETSTPMPSPIGKLRALYRYQWLIRTESVRPLLKVLRETCRRHDGGEVQIAVDVDALDLM